MKTLLVAPLFIMATMMAQPASAGIRSGGGSSSARSRSNSAPLGVNRYDPYSLANPHGAGSPYKTNGLVNPYSRYNSRYSNQSWRNPYATQAPKLYQGGNYRGNWNTNRYTPNSTSNPYGRYGNRHSPNSINNPYGAGNPYSKPIYVWPGTRKR